MSVDSISKHPLYRHWYSMRNRCNNRKYREFHLYGGRGITVCDRWSDFSSFVNDMGPRPSSRHSVERRDNNKGYSPDNCRWATPKEQARNRRSNKWLTCDGETKTLAEWSEISGVCIGTIQDRLLLGWDISRAVFETPRSSHRSSSRMLTFDGVTQPLSLWARQHGIRVSTLWERLKRGWSIDDALQRKVIWTSPPAATAR